MSPNTTPTSRDSHSLPNPWILAKSHCGEPTRRAPPLSFILWATGIWKGHVAAWVCQPGRMLSGEVASGRTLTLDGRCRGGPTAKAPFPLEVPSPPPVDNLFLFICSNLSSDQAGSPLIISVTPLHKPGQWSCVFLKITVPEIKLKKEEMFSPSQGLAGVLTGRSHQLCWLSSFAQNHKRTFRGKFLKRIQVGSEEGGGWRGSQHMKPPAEENVRKGRRWINAKTKTDMD